MRNSIKFMSSISAAAVAMSLAAPALAQVDEIVVTAQKREQNLQEVPIAVSALGAEKIEQLGISDSRDLSGLAPNVTVTQGTVSNSAAVIAIRGINTPATETFGLDTANALYVDGVYIARSAASGLDVVDIERVEILRGPQGTLFGRNTTGGAISFVSRDPSEEFRLRGEVGIGNFDAWNGKVILEPGRLGIFDTSFTYSHRQRDGIVDNLLEADDSNDPGARETDAFRFAAKADFSDTFSMRYIYDWSEVSGRVNPFQLTNVADGTPNAPITVAGQQVVVPQQANVAAYLAGATFLEPECAALATPQRAYRDTICLNSDAEAIDEVSGHNLQFTKDFENFKIKSITGYREWDGTVGGSDLDGIGTIQGSQFSNDTLFNGMPESLLQFIPSIPAAFRPFIAAAPVPNSTADLFTTSNDREHDQFSQEIEISGTTDSMDWVVGGFYFEEEGREINPQNSGFVLDTNNIFLGNFGALGPGFVAANPAQFRLVETNSVQDTLAEAESTALYGQVTLYPSGRDGKLNLTLGGRQTWDTKKMTRFQDGTTPFAVPETGEEDFSKFTFNATAAYQVNENVNAYARIASGYRSGGFNAADDAIAGTTTLPSFDEETLISYEAGLKTELFDDSVRLNVAVYHNQYEDLALIVPVSDGMGAFATRITNAGDVEFTGIEVEGLAYLSENFWIDGSAGYVDTQYNEFLAGTPVTGTEAVNIASIVRPQYTSPFTMNLAANFKVPLDWRDATMTGRLGYTHEDGKYSFNSVVAAPFNEEIKGDDRDIFDAQLTIDGIKVGDTEAYVRFWGKNIGDDHDLVRGIDFGPLGYAGGYFADPRTYGVTVGFDY